MSRTAASTSTRPTTAAATCAAPNIGPTGTGWPSAACTSSSTGAARSTEIDARLASAGLPPLRSATGTLPTGLPRAPIAVIWSPLPSGSPATKANQPDRFYPGAAYTDWAGTDFYSPYPELEGPHLPLQPLPAQALRPHRVGRGEQRRPELRQASLRLGAATPALQDARLLPGLRQRRTPTGSRTSRSASACFAAGSPLRSSRPTRRRRRSRLPRRRGAWPRSHAAA